MARPTFCTLFMIAAQQSVFQMASHLGRNLSAGISNDGW
jgi:hypothetical protein